MYLPYKTSDICMQNMNHNKDKTNTQRATCVSFHGFHSSEWE